jgi:hypothetical protein
MNGTVRICRNGLSREAMGREEKAVTAGKTTVKIEKSL